MLPSFRVLTLYAPKCCLAIHPSNQSISLQDCYDIFMTSVGNVVLGMAYNISVAFSFNRFPDYPDVSQVDDFCKKALT
jgi:hypothetical protein